MQPTNFIIVDDDAINNMMCQLSIARHFGPVPIHSYQNPDEALQVVASAEHPTVLLLDIHMPQMSGWEFLERFARLPDEIKNLFRIYILSGSANKSQIDQANNHLLVSGFVSKPLTENKLGKIFRELPESFGIKCFN